VEISGADARGHQLESAVFAQDLLQWSEEPVTAASVVPNHDDAPTIASHRCYDTRSPLKNIRVRRQIRQINSAILKVPDGVWIR
jgi:hypothetical protein